MPEEVKPIRVLVVGCGRMGKSHARAYQRLEGFKIAGLVSRTDGGCEELGRELGGGIPLFDDFFEALRQTRPDAVSINTYPDTHAEYAIAAMNADAHVFVEKPLAENMADAERLVETSQKTGKKLAVGYILQYHPTVARFLEIGKTLGKPLVMRMSLNQQSAGAKWETHKRLMESGSPIVDCGVHYVDIMCRVTGARALRVHAIGARLTDEIDSGQYNYGHLHVTFDDGSVGWFEAGWGPMMSEEARSVKDLIGPRGSVTLRQESRKKEEGNSDARPIPVSHLLVHRFERGDRDVFQRKDETLPTGGEPSHQDLCDLEQAFFLEAIREDLDLSTHHESALNSLRIVLAADESWRTQGTVAL